MTFAGLETVRRLKIMNPIALGMVALGVVLLVVGLLLVAKRSKVTGIAISLLGLGTAAAPFVITFFLFR
jgi:hypothetical protein